MVKVVTEIKKFYGKPGEAYHYSNTGSSILAEIIKRVYTLRAGTPKTYANYMEEYVKGPYTRVPLPRIFFPTLATDMKMPNPYIVSTIR